MRDEVERLAEALDAADAGNFFVRVGLGDVAHPLQRLVQDRQTTQAARGHKPIHLDLELQRFGVHQRQGREGVAQRNARRPRRIGRARRIDKRRGRRRQLDPDRHIHRLGHRRQDGADDILVIGNIRAHVLTVHMRTGHVQLQRVTARAHNGPRQFLPVRHLFRRPGTGHDRSDQHPVGIRGLDLFEIGQPKVQRLIRDQFPIPRRMRHRIGPFHPRDIWLLLACALVDRLGSGHVFHRVQPDGLGDNPAPTGLERLQDLAFAFGRRCRGQDERVNELQAGERSAKLVWHRFSPALI